MPITISVKDETAGGRIINETPIYLESELTTVKAIIIARVNTEVDAYNDRQPEYYRGLVQPTEAEITLNGYRLKDRKKIDPEQLTPRHPSPPLRPRRPDIRGSISANG